MSLTTCASDAFHSAVPNTSCLVAADMGMQLDWNSIHKQLADLGLNHTKYEEYNGIWYYITREHFDLFMLEEPYNSLVMLINFTTSEYIFRILGTTRDRGFYKDTEDLLNTIEIKFKGTVACVGNPRLRVDSGALVVEHPFSMTVSYNCLGYYRVDKEEEYVAQGRGRCRECRNLKSSEVKSNFDIFKTSKIHLIMIPSLFFQTRNFKCKM